MTEEEIQFWEEWKAYRKTMRADLRLRNSPLKDEFWLQGLKSSWMLNRLQWPRLTELYSSVDPALPLDIAVILYFTSFMTGHTQKGIENTPGHYIFGLLRLKNEFPHTIVYPETMAEKISELFHQEEVDFDDNKKFSFNFYTLTKEKESLKKLLEGKQLDDLAKFKTMELEFIKDCCLFRLSRKHLSVEEGKLFCEFAVELNRVIN